MSTQTQRERFEAWAATHDLDLTPGVPGQYSDCNTDYAWIAAQHFEAAAVERCAEIVETCEVSVGNSAAGEIACEMTMANLREILDEIRALLNDGEKS